MNETFIKLEQGVFAALETYSNVHRGSGFNSKQTTHLFEQARNIVLEYMGLNKGKYVVIFCTPRRAAILTSQLKAKSYQIISSQEFGLSLGVRALAINRKKLPKEIPFQTGGGTTRLVSPDWVVWAKTPDRFEAGTPAIVNIIAFAKALLMIQQFGKNIFLDFSTEKLGVNEILYHDELDKYSGQELLEKLRHTLIGRGIQVPTQEGKKTFINLDNGASTRTFTPIWKTFCQTWRQPLQVQQEVVQEVKSICAEVLGASLEKYDVIFTSNTTEAINLVAESLGKKSGLNSDSVIINTLLEHSSNDLPWRFVPGSSLIRLSVNSEGFLDLNELETLMSAYNQKGQNGKKRIKLVAVSGASNVLGIYNNIKKISRIVNQYGARLLVDAAQLVAHRKVNMEESGIDYLAFSAHKVYAPFGCGVLLVKKGLLNFTVAEMKQIQISGEENAGGIAALGKGLVLLQRIGLDLIKKEEQVLTRLTLQGVSQITGIDIYGIKEADAANIDDKGGVFVFNMKGKMANVVARELSELGGIGVRYGCHCSHILVKHVLGVGPFLERFQKVIVTLFPRVSLPGLTRVSLGIENTTEDVNTLIQALEKIAANQRSSNHRNSGSDPNKNPVVSQADLQKQINDYVKALSTKVYSNI